MSLRNYEVMLIADGGLTDEEAEKLFEKFKAIVTEKAGVVKFTESWGRRKLAYEINKKSYGVYQLLWIEANGEIIEEIERQVGYDDLMLKSFVLSVDNLEEAYQEFVGLKENPVKNSTLIVESLGA